MGTLIRPSPTSELMYREITKKKAKQVDVKEDYIPFLHPEPDFLSNDYISLDFSQGCFTLFIAPPGSGKTFALRGFIGQLIAMGYQVIGLSDIKNDFLYSHKPVQEKYQDSLPPWREPKGLPILPVIPYYLKMKQRSVRPPQGVEFFQVAIKEIDVIDIIKSYLELEEAGPQAQLLKQVWQPNNPPKDVINLMRRIDRVNTTMSKRFGFTDNLSFQKNTIVPVKRALTTILLEKIIGGEKNLDIIEALSNGRFVDLCFNHDRQYYREHSLYIAAIIRIVKRAKTLTRKLEGRTVFVFDDMGTLACPKKREPSCKDLIINDLISLGRASPMNAYIIGCTQNLAQIPEEIIAQVKHFVFFSAVSGTDIDIIARVRNAKPSQLRELMAKRDPSTGRLRQPVTLSNGTRSVLVWSTGEGGMRGRISYGWVPAPSSYVPGE